MTRVLLALVLLVAGAVSAEPPRAALGFRADLVREARAVWGLQAPVPVFAAQVHQESAWRVDARSPVGAEGLAQFMPLTGVWMTELYPAALGRDAQPFNPQWALRAMVRYDAWLHARVVGHTACDRFWAMLRAYNGGLGHWQAESRFAFDRGDRVSVDRWCGVARRAAVHCRENLDYPRRILTQHQVRYAAWGVQVTCDG